MHAPATEQPEVALGRHVTQATRDVPAGCIPAATPARLAGHTLAVPGLIDFADGCNSALVLTPIYVRCSDGALHGAHVAALRITAAERSPHPGDHGFGCIEGSAALIFEWDRFGLHAPSLGPALTGLRPEPVSSLEHAAKRYSVPRELVPLAAPTPELDPLAQAILGAVAAGARLRFGKDWCASEAAFIGAYLCALANLPPGLRGHVSASAGLLWPDDAVQVAWSPAKRGLRARSAAANWYRATGRALAAAVMPDRQPVAAAGAAPYPGDLIAGFGAGAGLQATVRRALAGAARSSGAVPDWTGVAFAAQEMPPAAAAARLRRIDAGLSPDDRTVQDIWGNLPTASEIGSLGELFDLIWASEEERLPSPGAWGVARALDDLRAWTGAQACIDADALAAIAHSPGLARLIATEIASRDPLLCSLFRRSFAATDQRTLIGPLLPKTTMLYTDWRMIWQDRTCLVTALERLAARPDRTTSQSIAAMAAAVLAQGEWRSVRNALAKASAAIGPEDLLFDPAAAADCSGRLRFISALASAFGSAGRVVQCR